MHITESADMSGSNKDYGGAKGPKGGSYDPYFLWGKANVSGKSTLKSEIKERSTRRDETEEDEK